MRLFVAVWPPEWVLDAVAALPRPEVGGVRWTGRGQWHVTLRFLGTVDEPGPVAAALGEGLAGVAPAVAVLGPEVAPLGRHVLMAPVAGLDEVAAAVVTSTASLGSHPPESRPFTGHLTLARSKGPSVRALALAGEPLAGSWPVTEVCLVRSHLERGGARYETLAGVPLGG